MRVYVKITNVQDSIELIDLLGELRKIRNNIWGGPTKDFMVEVNSKMRV